MINNVYLRSLCFFRYSLEISVSDSNPLHDQTVLLTVLVKNINDNAPVLKITPLHSKLNSPSSLFVSENEDKETKIGFLTLHDKDDLSLQPLLYLKKLPHLPESDEQYKTCLNQPIPIKRTSENFLVTTKKLDREVCRSYLIEVKACDVARKQLCSVKTLNLEIIDKNEHVPLWNQPCPRKISISEDKSIGSLAFSARANDQDFDAKLEYSLSSSNLPFSISEGEVILKQELDREEVDAYEFNVKVSDGEFDIVCGMSVSVEDINDNAPVFSEQMGSDIFIPFDKRGELPRVGSVLATIKVSVFGRKGRG